MRVYRRGSDRGVMRALLLVLLALLVLGFAYLLLAFGEERVVLLGSDARAGEASRSDTIVWRRLAGGCSRCRGTRWSRSLAWARTR